ncbi:MAG: hypothetical protein ACKO5Z_01645, partial [Burkholderiaceae bacterium]
CATLSALHFISGIGCYRFAPNRSKQSLRAGSNNDFARKINNLCGIVTNYFQKKPSIPPESV